MPGNYDDDSPDFSLREVLDTLRRRKWMILQAFLFVAVIGAVIAFVTPPTYATASQLVVSAPDNTIFTQVQTDNPLGPLMVARQNKSIETQLAIMNSNEFQRRIRAHLAPSDLSAGVVMNYSSRENTSIIDIKAEGLEPHATANWANVAADQYVDLTRESNQGAIVDTEQYLRKTVKNSKRALDKAEGALFHFKQRTSISDSAEARGEQAKHALELQRAAADAQDELLSDQAQLQALQKQLDAEPKTLKDSQTLVNPQADAYRSQIIELKTEKETAIGQGFLPTSQRVKKIDDRINQFNQALSQISGTITRDTINPNPRYQELLGKVKDLMAQVDAARVKAADRAREAVGTSGTIRDTAAQEVEMARLQREKDEAQKTYEQSSDSLRDLELRKKTMGSTATILQEAAVPRSPIRPQKAQQVALSAVLGLLLGVGLAFLQEFLDDRVNTSEDVDRVMALPTLGVVPTIGEDGKRLLVDYDVLSPVTESYRALRNAVQYSSVDQPIRELIVTSSHAGEGKSVTSANLGIAMALQGKKVILVDADLRRPSVHRLFGLSTEPGLSSILAGEATIDQALHSTSVEGLQVICSGPLPPNPPELLQSQSMQDLMTELSSRADLIIYDTPPTIPVTDAQVLSVFVDGVVMVVEAGRARKAAVKHARDLLDQTRARLLGVVLNKIDQSSKGYYYHYYYRGGYDRYGYSYGYGHKTGKKLGGKVGSRSGKSNGTVAELPEKLPDWE